MSDKGECIMRYVTFALCTLALIFAVGIVWAQSTNAIFVAENGRAIGGIGIGLAILLITAAVAVGKRINTYDTHIADEDVHVSHEEMNGKFVDKVDCAGNVRLLRETREVVIRIDEKVDAITNTLKNRNER